MTLDAMHWVWNHSQSKGNARLALLAVADQARTPACEVRLSYPDLMAALNASSRTTVRAALEAAEKLGELEVAESGSGRRAPLYRLPKAVGYVRPASSSGPDSVPLDSRSGTEPVPQNPKAAPRSGTGSVPKETRSSTDFDRSGTDSGPHYPYQVTNQQAGQQQSDDYGIPDTARPLVDAMSRAGLGYIRWPFQGNEWFPILSLIKKSGVEAMVKHAVKAASRTSVESAKYFMRGWGQLPPLPQGPPPPSRDSPGRRMPPWCRDPDCDEKTRLCDVEGDNGLRYSAPCPNCHPSRKEPAA